MTKIVQVRPASVPLIGYADLLEQALKRVDRLVVGQGRASLVDEHAVGRACGAKPLPALHVVSKDVSGAGVQWNEAGLPELGRADRQDRFLEVNILEGQSGGLSDTKA